MDRVLVLYGSLHTSLVAVLLICLRLFGLEIGVAGPQVQDAAHLLEFCTSNKESLRLVIPSPLCGRVIGRSGRTITEIAHLSGCNLSFGPEPIGFGSLRERVLTISGMLLSVLRAVAMVVDKLVSPPTAQEDWQEGAREWHTAGLWPSAAGSGLGAATWGGMSPQAAAFQPMPAAGPYAMAYHRQQPMPAPAQATYYFAQPLGAALLTATPMAMPLAPQQMQAPQQMPAAVPMQQRGQGAPQMQAVLGGPVQQGMLQASAMAAGSGVHQHQALQGMLQQQHQQHASGGQDLLGPRVELSIECPDNRVGVIIGRQGETLASLQRLLNVQIHIAPRTPGSALRKVTISGDCDHVNTAHQVILQRLSAHRRAAAGSSAPGPLQAPAAAGPHAQPAPTQLPAAGSRTAAGEATGVRGPPEAELGSGAPPE